MNRIVEMLERYKYLIALLSMINFLLTPLHIAIFHLAPSHVVVINYTLLILASSLIAAQPKWKLRTYVLGFLALACIWVEFSMHDSQTVKICRLIATLALFINFCVLLLHQLRTIKTINLQFILGPILGFIYLGIIGGIFFEFAYLLDPASFEITTQFSGYSFYYFSFISITTVGYGDIIPTTPSAQSLTLVLNIIGQFYLAIVIAVFVGKYINVKS